MKEPTVRLLRRLLEQGSIPASAVPRSAWSDLRGLTESGAVRAERSGAGMRYILDHPGAVEGLLRAQRPQTPGPSPELPPRAEAVRRFRDAKRATPEESTLVFLRATRPCRLEGPTDALDVHDLTRRFGVAGAMLSPDDSYSFNGPIGMVENLEPFRHCHRLDGADACAGFLYYAGRASAGLLNWLAARPRAPELVVFPDYDPVGLQEYDRIRRRSACPVRLHVPPDPEALIRDHGKHELLTDNTNLLPALETLGDPVVDRLIRLMQRHGRGLEQEILIR